MSLLLEPSLWSTTVVLGIPIAYAALAGVLSERAGVVNIALEGKMLVGAFAGVAAAAVTHNPWLGVLAAFVAGAALAALFGWATVYLRADHIIAGMAINLLALGLTGFLFEIVYGPLGTPSNTPTVPIWTVPGLSEIPWFGEVLGRHQALVFLFVPLALAIGWMLFRTPLGLRWRAVGEFPRAADAAGVGVLRLKFGAVLLAGGIAGLGGADVSIGILNAFSPNMTAGRGYIALAAVIFSGWRPGRAFGAALLFGFATALSYQLQGASPFPKNLLLMLPYVVTLLALAGLVGRTSPPAAIGEHYDPGR
ncbi:MAG: ABC transporter permease [SAR324 cluster bacterium]|nr:ABC transporter permease [SAR324 cluster bacterium]